MITRRIKVSELREWLTELRNDSSTESDANRKDWKEMLDETIYILALVDNGDLVWRR